MTMTRGVSPHESSCLAIKQQVVSVCLVFVPSVQLRALMFVPVASALLTEIA